MTRIRFFMAVLACTLAAPIAGAQALVRGPYLQSATPSTLVIRWRTDTATDSKVVFNAVGDSSETLVYSDLTTEHEVALEGLQPDTTYLYTVGSTTAVVAGGDSSYSFVTPPLPGVDEPAYIWVIGDSGTANANAAAVRDGFKLHAAGRKPNLWLMLGDNAYATGTDAEYQVAVFDMYPELLRGTALWSTVGNHDTYAAVPAYPNVFTFPTAGEAGGLATGTEAYYSFDFGNIHFVSLNSMLVDLSAGGPMLTWLANDLAANDKHWIVAFWHHPPYTKGSHNSDTEQRHIDMRGNALPILEAYGVDLILGGHSHSYERSYLLSGHYGLSTSLDAATMIVDRGNGLETGDGAYAKGDAGASNEGAVFVVAGSSGKANTAPFGHPVMIAEHQKLGSMALSIAGNRLEAEFIDDHGDVLDAFTLIKGADVFPPAVIRADPVSDTSINVDFSEPLALRSAENSTNYSIPGVSVTAAVLAANAREVMLTVDALSVNTLYQLAVTGVEDVAGNVIDINNQASVFLESITQVSIDIDPWSTTNFVDPGIAGQVNVAIFSSSTLLGDPIDFDTSSINPATLMFGAGKALAVGALVVTDLDGDSDADMGVVFDVPDSGIVCEDTQASLLGQTLSGDDFYGVDAITTPTCPTSTCHP